MLKFLTDEVTYVVLGVAFALLVLLLLTCVTYAVLKWVFDLPSDALRKAWMRSRLVKRVEEARKAAEKHTPGSGADLENAQKLLFEWDQGSIPAWTRCENSYCREYDKHTGGHWHQAGSKPK